MLRFLVLALLVLLVWRATMLLLDRAGVSGRRQVTGRRRRSAPAAGEELIRCATCGTRVPLSRALGAAELRYCSPACRPRTGSG